MPSTLPAPYDSAEPHAACRIVQAPAVPTAVVRRTGFPVSRMPKLMDAVFPHLVEALASAGVQAIGPAFALHHRFPVDDADLEVGVPVDRPLEEAIVLPSGVRVEGSQLPQGRVAIRSHLGGYGGLSETWGAMTEEIGDAGEQSRFPIWEFYVSNPAEVARPSELRTDLVTLLEERAATRA